MLSLQGNSGGAKKKKKKTVSATNLRITDCTSKNNMKKRKKSLFVEANPQQENIFLFS